MQKAFPGSYWVRAEIAAFNYYQASGHTYLTLVEKQNRTTKAQARAVIWANNYEIITGKFREQTGEQLRQDLTVLLLIDVRFHAQYGLSLTIRDIDPVFTLGLMAKQRLEAIQKLKQKGFFEKNKSLRLSILPKRIAVISVNTSKGYQDFCGVLQRHRDHFVIDHDLFPAVLQGAKAVQTIREALISIFHRMEEFDLVAIIRGGGGEVGLSAYDDVRLATAVAKFPLPVLCGIGHAQNETVVDMVSNRHFMTPTDLGNFLLSIYQESAGFLAEMETNLANSTQLFLAEQSEKLYNISHMFIANTQISMHHEMRELESLRENFVRYSGLVVNQFNKEIDSVQFQLGFAPAQSLRSAKDDQISLFDKLRKQLEIDLMNRDHDISMVENSVLAMDPRKVLQRGFSITRTNGKAIKSNKKLKKGDFLETQLFSGKVKSKVE